MIGKDKLRIRRELLDSDAIPFQQINDQYKFLSSFAIDGKFVDQILDLLHEGLAVDPNGFVIKVFFEFQQSVRKTERNKKRIYSSLAKLGNLNIADDEQLEMINIYRSVVSELFDPYISLIVAIIQFKEGTFSNYIGANLGAQERSKVEYCLARLKLSQLFSGYNPIVRNAVTHPGTDGLKFDGDKIVFRNINRGIPPKSDIITWSGDELNNKILQLMDFVNSTDIAGNIFGMDISDMIRKDKDLHASFIADILSIKERNELRAAFDESIENIFQSSKNHQKKLDAFSVLFIIECKKRELNVKSVKFREAERSVYIVLENNCTDLMDDDKLLNRVNELLRFAVLAEPCFRLVSNLFWVMEEEMAGEKGLAVRTQGDLLWDYGEEKAGLIDLLHECEVYIDKERISIEVDFSQISAVEQQSFEKSYPRKNRE